MASNHSDKSTIAEERQLVRMNECVRYEGNLFINLKTFKPFEHLTNQGGIVKISRRRHRLKTKKLLMGYDRVNSKYVYIYIYIYIYGHHIL